MLTPQFTFLLILFAMVVAGIAQFRVSSAFKKFSRVRTRRGLTGAEVAQEILTDAGIHDVEVTRTNSWLGDHYDPSKVVYTVLTIFQLITLPVEFDASRRAKLILTQRGVVTCEESTGVASVLNAAAWTYVAAFLSAFFNLLYLLVLRDRR